jgi:hypothetical protein
VGDADDDVAAGGEVGERLAGGVDVERGDVGRGEQQRARVPVDRRGRGVDRRRLERAIRGDRRGPAPRAAPQQRGDPIRAVLAEQRPELGVGRRGKRLDDDRGRVSPS